MLVRKAGSLTRRSGPRDPADVGKTIPRLLGRSFPASSPNVDARPFAEPRDVRFSHGDRHYATKVVVGGRVFILLSARSLQIARMVYMW
jgi:hypothetical protein